MHLNRPIPPNDAFADAQPLSGSTTSTSGTNWNATKEPDEPDHAGFPGGASVWYSWTAPTSGRFRVGTCSSSTNFYSTVDVYTGTDVSTLTHVNTDEAICGTWDSYRMIFQASAGTQYHFAVDVQEGGTSVFPPDAGNFTIAVRPAQEPANDARSNATTLSGLHSSVAGSTVDATLEPDEIWPYPGAASVWYRWTAPADGKVVFDGCSSLSYLDTIVVVGAPGAAPGSWLAANDDHEQQCLTEVEFPWQYYGGSYLTFDAQAGHDYLIGVDGYGGFEGQFQFKLDQTPSPTPPPASSTGTGKRAAALAKCKRKHSAKSRKKCRKKAKLLPL